MGQSEKALMTLVSVHSFIEIVVLNIISKTKYQKVVEHHPGFFLFHDIHSGCWKIWALYFAPFHRILLHIIVIPSLMLANNNLGTAKKIFVANVEQF